MEEVIIDDDDDDEVEEVNESFKGKSGRKTPPVVVDVGVTEPEAVELEELNSNPVSVDGEVDELLFFTLR